MTKIDLETICYTLKQLGVQEVILEIEGEIPTITFAGFGGDPGEHFKVKATNAAFVEYEL